MRVKSLTLAGAAVAILGMGAATPAFAASDHRGTGGSSHVECFGKVTQGKKAYGQVFVVHRHGKMVGGLKVTKAAKPGIYGITGRCKRVRTMQPTDVVFRPTVVTQTTVVPVGAAKTGFGGSQESNVPLTAAGLSLLLAGGAGLGLLARRRLQARARS